MKKILMVMMILTTFLFVSCKNSIEETYTVDGGFIAENTCSELKSKTEWLCPSYTNFTLLRDYLRDNSISGFWSEVWTVSEVEQFLLSSYSSTEEAKETIRFIKENGYNIILFSTYETNKKGWKGWMSISRN